MTPTGSADPIPPGAVRHAALGPSSRLEKTVFDTNEKSAARAAAEWWARQIADPTFRITTPEEDRASTRDEFLGTMYMRGLAGTLADQHPVTSGQLAKFTDALKAIIIRDTDDHGWHYGLHVDYHPDASLAEAAETAGIDESRFPYKTNLWLHQNGPVTARLGYGAPARLIWAPPGWNRPTCGNLRAEADPNGGHFDRIYFPQVCTRPMYHEHDCGDWALDTVTCDECGKGRADHYNGSYDDFGHVFRTADDA